MNSTVSISVVIPLYNKERVIDRTIHSILNQSYQEFEIIVIDDGSTDNSAAVVKKLSAADNRINLITTVNGGPGKARNNGLEHAKGDLVYFIDADDEIDKDFFKIAITRFNENPDVSVFSASHYRTILDRKYDFTNYFQDYQLPKGKFKATSDTDVYTLLGLTWFHHSSAVICKTEVVRKYGGFYSAHKSLYGEDSYLWIQVILNEVCFCEHKTLCWYHTEDSDLCGGSYGIEPPVFLLHPEKIRQSSAQEIKEKTEELLGLFSMVYILDTLSLNSKSIEGILKRFPAIKHLEHGRKLVDYIEMQNKHFATIKQGKLAKLIKGPPFWRNLVTFLKSYFD